MTTEIRPNGQVSGLCEEPTWPAGQGRPSGGQNRRQPEETLTCRQLLLVMHTCFPPQGEVAQASRRGRTVGTPDLATMPYETKMDLSTWLRSSLGLVARVTSGRCRWPSCHI